MAVYLEIESIEWVDYIPDGEDKILITSEEGSYNVTSVNYNVMQKVMQILNEHSEDGWEVVHFTDTFNYIETKLQRRKCYLLRKS